MFYQSLEGSIRPRRSAKSMPRTCHVRGMFERTFPDDLASPDLPLTAADAEWLEALAIQKRTAAGSSTAAWAIQHRAEEAGPDAALDRNGFVLFAPCVVVALRPQVVRHGQVDRLGSLIIPIGPWQAPRRRGLERPRTAAARLPRRPEWLLKQRRHRRDRRGSQRGFLVGEFDSEHPGSRERPTRDEQPQALKRWRPDTGSRCGRQSTGAADSGHRRLSRPQRRAPRDPPPERRAAERPFVRRRDSQALSSICWRAATGRCRASAARPARLCASGSCRARTAA